jgi:hypothetical protein
MEALSDFTAPREKAVGDITRMISCTALAGLRTKCGRQSLKAVRRRGASTSSCSKCQDMKEVVRVAPPLHVRLFGRCLCDGRQDGTLVSLWPSRFPLVIIVTSSRRVPV